MRLCTLHLSHFRSFSALDLDLSCGDLHLFIGKNGSGKTNLLHSISILSTGRSFLSLEEHDLIRQGHEYYRVRGAMQSDAGDKSTVEVISQLAPRKQKACFRNDVKIPVTSLIGNLPIILFLPQDIDLLMGPPSERRRFLDDVLSQAFPEYFRFVSDYQKLLKQRNALLRRIADGVAKNGDLDPWDSKLAEVGAAITVSRLELIETLGMSLCSEMTALGEEWKEAKIIYARTGEARTREEAHSELSRLFSHYRERDIIIQSTTVGPHRDDWYIEVDAHRLTSFASRGQQRVAVLSLLFLESSYVELRRGEKPIVLLDDVFSELDDAHQEALLRSFSGYQVLITGTHFPRERIGAACWKVEAGTVSALNSGK